MAISMTTDETRILISILWAGQVAAEVCGTNNNLQYKVVTTSEIECGLPCHYTVLCGG